jgi:hypothetical protein
LVNNVTTLAFKGRRVLPLLKEIKCENKLKKGNRKGNGKRKMDHGGYTNFSDSN